MKSDRLLSALMLLQGHGRLSTRELAERLEVSQRTAHRDMEALCTAGVPLIAYRGASGGWELAKGWRTKVPGLDDAELRALLMAQPSALGDARLAAAARSAFDKLMASLSAPMKAQAESMRARLHIDSTGWRPSSEDWSVLPIVQEALAGDRKLTFFYTRADGERSTRTVDPLGLVCKQMVWYLVARAPAGMRTYRISRMRGAVALALTFDRPAKFDLARYWQQSTATLRSQQQHFLATLALSAEGVEFLERWSRMRPIEKHPGAARLREGWRIFEIEFESGHQARFVALGLGADALALAPEELCGEVARELARMLELSRR